MIASVRQFLAIAVIVALNWPVMAAAQGVSVQAVQSMSLDTVASGNGDTVFRVAAASGFVSRISGTGQRLGNGSARALVTIACGSDADCDSQNVVVSIASLGSSSGRISGVGAFTISAGSANIVGDPAGNDPTSFTIGPIGAGGTATFYLGGDVTVEGSSGGGSTGAASTMFQIAVAFEGAGETDTVAGTVLATVLRPVEISSSSPLAFGKIIRPAQGSGSVVIDAATGVRTMSGADFQAIGSDSSNAQFAISGEGGQEVSLSVPDTMILNSGQNTLEVALTATITSATLSGALGGEGAAELGVGGTIAIDSATPTGAYSGTFEVVAAYN